MLDVKFPLTWGSGDKPTIISIKCGGQDFPLFSVGRQTYVNEGIIGTSVTQVWGMTGGRVIAPHNIHIGRHTSIAQGMYLAVGSSHNFKNIFMGTVADFNGLEFTQAMGKNTFQDRGQILIQNDVWFGHHVNVMGGVTIFNGAVVAANSHVVKDVPPYAIVGGNPARVIKYRFSDDIIHRLLEIKWWNWSYEKLKANREWFLRNDPAAFCERFYDEARAEREAVPQFPFIEPLYRKKLYLFFLDLGRPFALWRYVIDKFVELYGDKNDRMLLAIVNDDAPHEVINEFKSCLETANRERLKVIVMNKLPDERTLFSGVDYYIAGRELEAIARSEHCRDYGVKILSGVDRGGF